LKFAVIVHPVLTELPHVFVQFTNSYVRCAVCVFGVAVTVLLPIVKIFEFIEISVQYGTVTDGTSTVPEFVLFDTILTV